MSGASTFTTAGEQLVGRELRMELRGGVLHYKPGQHEASCYASHVDGEIELCARLTYADAVGHACVVVCVLGETGTWTPTLTARAGQSYVEQIRPAPANFELSEPMLEALANARTIVAVSESPEKPPA